VLSAPPARKPDRLRIGVYGTGRWANGTHIPILRRLDAVDLVALCDVDHRALTETAARWGIDARHTYDDGHEMVDAEDLDVLFSCVPAYARTDVEVAAVRRGIHLFSEKPQALDLSVAFAIDAAVRRAGVISTVGFRERYRPMFHAVRDLLAGKDVVHVRFTALRPLPTASPRSTSWWDDEARSGGPMLDWGVHAVDYARFLTGLDVTAAQAFYTPRTDARASLAAAFNLRFANAGSMTLTFVNALPSPRPTHPVPVFQIYYRGGVVALYRAGRCQWRCVHHHAGRVDAWDEAFDPWFAQDRVFIDAVRTGDAAPLRNDYHDGLFSLAPVLAGWTSAQRDGVTVAIAAFMDAARA
jgi:predicted dehydrogenase